MNSARSLLAAALLVPALALAGCSGSGDSDESTNGSNGSAATPTQSAEGGDATSAATDSATDGSSASPSTGASGATTTKAAGDASARDAREDVKVTKCALDDGTATVEATVKNSGKSDANYIVSVAVESGGKKVDGVAIMVPTVPAGEEAKGEMEGQKSDLKGKITCKIVDVKAL